MSAVKAAWTPYSQSASSPPPPAPPAPSPSSQHSASRIAAMEAVAPAHRAGSAHAADTASVPATGGGRCSSSTKLLYVRCSVALHDGAARPRVAADGLSAGGSCTRKAARASSARRDAATRSCVEERSAQRDRMAEAKMAQSLACCMAKSTWAIHQSLVHSRRCTGSILECVASRCMPWPMAMRIAKPIQCHAFATISSCPSEYHVISSATCTYMHMHAHQQHRIQQRQHERVPRVAAAVLRHKVLLVHNRPSRVHAVKVGAQQAALERRGAPRQGLGRHALQLVRRVAPRKLAAAKVKGVASLRLRDLPHQVAKVGHVAADEAHAAELPELGVAQVLPVDEVGQVAGLMFLVLC
ncbi:hypothetical protein BM221_006057 [Beauveria bassiana]|uniref:Uncharacterized protein n=1 Tax=Beauveria bassiana TaxID=176275 RepID=A0A2N6NKS5_BEABA|nr:hypothetical protein BM221_006057 [Beauveria bassiana]